LGILDIWVILGELNIFGELGNHSYQVKDLAKLNNLVACLRKLGNLGNWDTFVRFFDLDQFVDLDQFGKLSHMVKLGYLDKLIIRENVFIFGYSGGIYSSFLSYVSILLLLTSNYNRVICLI
jgi:hypothetical protein